MPGVSPAANIPTRITIAAQARQWLSPLAPEPFVLLYLDGYDWRKVPLEERKKKLASILVTGDSLRYSDDYEREGKALFEVARQKGLEGILAKKRDSFTRSGAAADRSK